VVLSWEKRASNKPEGIISAVDKIRPEYFSRLQEQEKWKKNGKTKAGTKLKV
jgi:hypothetical protein